MSLRATNEATIRSYVRGMLTDKINALASQANSDLWWGPYAADEDYPGFQPAIDAISAELSQVGIGDLWLDCGFVCDREPEPYECPECSGGKCESCNFLGVCEPLWEEITHYSYRDVLIAAFGKDLAPYLW